MSNEKMNFPQDFILGAAISAWQTEGSYSKKDTQDSFMDLWYKESPDLWHDGYGPTFAIDLYKNYKTDIQFMKKVGLQSLRTSIDWSRFLIDYENAIVDNDALKFYQDYFNEMINNGIEPMICLEHYELPAELFKKYGGWGSKHVVELFVKYAEKVFESFGNKVKAFFTFNEPIVVQTRCYLDSIRFPYVQNTKLWMQWNYNKVLATAKVVNLFKQKKYEGKIGIILNPEVTYPRSSEEHDKKAAYMYDLFYNRIFLDSSVKGEIPKDLFKECQKHNIMFDYTENELKIIKENTVDCLGLNLYYPHRVKANTKKWNDDVPFHPSYYYELFEMPGRKMNPYRGWEIYPKIIYDMAMRIKNEYNNIEWFISESGMGVQNEYTFRDDENIIQDDYRIEFISEHLKWVLKAIEDGSNCKGYMLWAFIDNVSPMNAFKNRYGLVEVDLENDLARKIKKSGYWYKEISEKRSIEASFDKVFK